MYRKLSIKLQGSWHDRLELKVRDHNNNNKNKVY